MPSIKIDLSGVYEKFSDANLSAGQRAMANQMLTDMNENFVPERSGDLRMSATIAMDGKSIIWNSSYARYMYYGSSGWNYTTPGTGPRWDKKAQGIFMSDWIDAFTKGANF